MDDVLKLLELIRRELDADDARIELGGREPEDARHVWCPLPGGFRLVAILSAAPRDPKAVRARLLTLAEPFRDLEDKLGEEVPRPARSHARRRLDDALATLAEQAGARWALVMDESSPVIWGCSEAALREQDVDLAIRAVGGNLEDDDPWCEALAAARALAHLRSQRLPSSTTDVRIAHAQQTFGYLARGLGSIYLLVVAFEGPFSELHAEGAMVRALPGIEGLVMSLPPIDTPPRGGKVIKLHPNS